MGEPRYIIVHSHFYQPPRESPWTGLIGAEQGAAPFTNWNERILSECYTANAHAHTMQGPVVHVRNNYESLSFELRLGKNQREIFRPFGGNEVSSGAAG